MSATALRGRRQAGFNLLESLVAMAVLAVAAVALVQAARAQLTTTDRLESRSIALWVAENRLAALTLDPGAPPRLTPERSTMLGRTWLSQVESRTTDDPDLLALTVTVGEVTAGEATPVQQTASLSGFIDVGAGRRP